MEATRPATPSTQQEWETLSKEGKLPTTSTMTGAVDSDDEEEDAVVDILLRPFERIGADMAVSDSFSLPALSDDEDSDDDGRGPLSSPEARGPNPAIQGRSLKAAARTTAGTARLTDGFGEFTAAVPGFRTVRRTRAQPLPIDAAGEDLAEPMAENDEMNAAEKAEVRRRVRAQQLRAEAAAVEVVPVIPRTLPVRLQRQPTGSGPPFVYVPGCYESAADSEIRATSILEDDELDKVQFARPRPAGRWPQPRASADSSRVVGKAYAGPGHRQRSTQSSSQVQLTTSELVALGALRGTAFAPFSVQQGLPRPAGVTWDAPWDRTQRNVVAKRLWRVPGADCDRTPLPTSKQGHRPRTLGQHEHHAAARQRGHSTRRHASDHARLASPIATPRPSASAWGFGPTSGFSGFGQASGEDAGEDGGGGGLRARSAVTPGRPAASLADGTGVVGGAGRRGGSFGAPPWSAPNSTLTANHGTQASPLLSAGRAAQLQALGATAAQAASGHAPCFAPFAPLSKGSLAAPRAHRPGTTDGVGPKDHVDHMLHGGAGATAGVNPLAPGAAYTPGVVGSSNEYVIHDDPLAHLPPQVLQLLNEKNIALRLWPPARVDVRMRVRAKFEAPNDRYRDSEVVGTKLLGDRLVKQGLDAAANLHPSDEVDALKPASLVQASRVPSPHRPPPGSFSFPVPPWDGTTRNATAGLGLWRDPGWDLHAALGDLAHASRRSNSPSLQNA